VSRLKPAYSAASDTFNQGFMVHLARRVCASSQLLPNVHKVARSGALAYGRRAGNSGARCGLMLPASKTGTLSVAVVARHVVMRPEASGSHWSRCSLEWPGDTATPRWCTAAACPEGDAVCGCESLISKWHCVRSRFRTVLKSGSGLSVVALRAVTFSAPRRMILSRRVCSKHGR
jgi:hypothetical protein